jgi:hypothetical protein
MQFMVMTFESAGDVASREGPSAAKYWQGWSAYTTALREAGVLVGGAALKSKDHATCVRIAAGKLAVQDGPYADTKEQLGGYYILEVADLDAALSWAARCPAAINGAVEVRPLLPMG